jgi:hypothetical protein
MFHGNPARLAESASVPRKPSFAKEAPAAEKNPLEMRRASHRHARPDTIS